MSYLEVNYLKVRQGDLANETNKPKWLTDANNDSSHSEDGGENTESPPKTTILDVSKEFDRVARLKQI